MISKEKARALLALYRHVLEERGYADPAFVCPRDTPVERQDVLKHCHTLLCETDEHIKNQKWALFDKRIKFVQGCFFTLQIFTLDEMEAHLRTTDDSVHGQAVLPMPLPERMKVS